MRALGLRVYGLGFRVYGLGGLGKSVKMVEKKIQWSIISLSNGFLFQRNYQKDPKVSRDMCCE